MTYFKHMFFQKPEKLKRKNINGRRHYVTPSGEAVPSVTTVLSHLGEEGLNAWKKSVGEEVARYVSRRATTNGTEFHKIVETFLGNKPIDSFTKVTPRGLFNQAEPELKRINNILALETSLYSNYLKLAGTVDCIAEFDKKPSIIDFKSASKKKKEEWLESYFLQETAYSLMLEELTGKSYKNIVTIISAEDGTVSIYEKNRDSYTSRLNEVIEEYNERVKNGVI